jgi:hypothetical protein
MSNKARRGGGSRGRWVVAAGCLLGGAGLLFVGDELGLPTAGPGVVLVGVAFLLGGLDSIIERRHQSGRAQAFAQIEYVGGSAVSWGAAFSLIGLAIMGAGLVRTLGADASVLALLERRPGPAIAGTGLVVASIGRGLMGRWRRASGETATALTLLPARLGGAAMLLLGAGLVAVGLVEIARPSVFDAAVGRVLEALPRLPALPDDPRLSPRSR